MLSRCLAARQQRGAHTPYQHDGGGSEQEEANGREQEDQDGTHEYQWNADAKRVESSARLRARWTRRGRLVNLAHFGAEQLSDLLAQFFTAFHWCCIDGFCNLARQGLDPLLSSPRSLLTLLLVAHVKYH